MPGPVASPDLTLKINPPVGLVTDYTQYFSWSGAAQQPTITQNFGRQGDTALFPLVDDFSATGVPNVVIQPLSTVQLIDNTLNQTLFAGVCTDPVFTNTSPVRNEWSVQCTDFTYYADKQVVHGTFIGQTVDQIVIALTQQANCGITAKKVSQGGFVSPGPQLASFVLNYTSLSSAWRRLAQLAGSVVPYGWYVDENLELHFFNSTDALASGTTFTTRPTGVGGSTTEGHFMQDGTYSYEWDATSLFNRVLVQGATQTIGYGNSTSKPPTDVWKGNGAQQAWPLRATVSGSPVLKINNVKTTVEVVSAGQTSTAIWQILQNSVGTWFLVNTSKPPSTGVVIKLWYDYQVPIVAQANEFRSQARFDGPNHGVFTEYISDSSLITVPMALSRALREREEYAFPVERVTFTTDPSWAGWVRSGQTFRLVNDLTPDSQRAYALGIDDHFICIGNTISFGDGGYRQASITGIRLFTG
jgi:hypothetical protein